MEVTIAGIVETAMAAVTEAAVMEGAVMEGAVAAACAAAGAAPAQTSVELPPTAMVSRSSQAKRGSLEEEGVAIRYP